MTTITTNNNNKKINNNVSNELGSAGAWLVFVNVKMRGQESEYFFYDALNTSGSVSLI